MAWVTQADYAKKRGVDPSRITRLKQQGRLKGAIRRNGRRTEINEEKADALLASTIDLSWNDQVKLAAPASGPAGGNGNGSGGESSGGLDFNAANRLRMLAVAGLKKLELEEKSGKLVKVQDVENAAFNRARAVRDSLLAIPDRLAPILAAETDPVKTAQTLTAEIRQALEELSR